MIRIAALQVWDVVSQHSELLSTFTDKAVSWLTAHECIMILKYNNKSNSGIYNVAVVDTLNLKGTSMSFLFTLTVQCKPCCGIKNFGFGKYFIIRKGMLFCITLSFLCF